LSLLLVVLESAKLTLLWWWSMHSLRWRVSWSFSKMWLLIQIYVAISKWFCVFDMLVSTCFLKQVLLQIVFALLWPVITDGIKHHLIILLGPIFHGVCTIEIMKAKFAMFIVLFIFYLLWPSWLNLVCQRMAFSLQII